MGPNGFFLLKFLQIWLKLVNMGKRGQHFHKGQSLYKWVKTDQNWLNWLKWEILGQYMGNTRGSE